VHAAWVSDSSLLVDFAASRVLVFRQVDRDGRAAFLPSIQHPAFFLLRTTLLPSVVHGNAQVIPSPPTPPDHPFRQRPTAYISTPFLLQNAARYPFHCRQGVLHDKTRHTDPFWRKDVFTCRRRKSREWPF
jgi:hypothetical protein